MYVNAKGGFDSERVVLFSPLQQEAVIGCLLFQFSLFVSSHTFLSLVI